MAEILVRIPDYEHKMFQSKVGPGNMSAAIRQYIKHCIEEEGNEKEKVIRKRFDLIDEEKKKITKEWSKLKSKIDIIEDKKRIEELKVLEEEEQEKKKKSDIKHNTIKTHLNKVV